MALGLNIFKMPDSRYPNRIGSDLLSPSGGGGVVSNVAWMLDYGTDAPGVCNTQKHDVRYDWYISDGSIIMFTAERKVLTKSRNISGKISYKMPLDLTSSEPLEYSTVGTGGLNFNTASYSDLWNDNLKPSADRYSTGGSDLIRWKQTTDFIDLTIGPTKNNAPTYHIYSYNNFYGPTGYWITSSASNINYDEVYPIQVYVSATETAKVNYSITQNGTVVSTGEVDSNTVLVYLPTYITGANTFAVTLSDANNRSITLAGPVLNVIHDIRPIAEFITQSGQYRSGKPITVSFKIFDADYDPINWTLYKNNSIVSSGSSTAGITIDHSLLLSGTNTFKVIVSDPFKSSAPVEGPTIKVVDWKDISHP